MSLIKRREYGIAGNVLAMLCWQCCAATVLANANLMTLIGVLSMKVHAYAKNVSKKHRS